MLCMLEVLFRTNALSDEIFLSPVGLLASYVQKWHIVCLISSFTESILGFLLVNRQLGSSPLSTFALHLIPRLTECLSSENNFETEDVSLFFFTVSPNANDFIVLKAALLSLLLSCFRTSIAPLRSVATALYTSVSFSSSGDFTTPFFWSAFLSCSRTLQDSQQFQPFSLGSVGKRFWFGLQPFFFCHMAFER